MAYLKDRDELKKINEYRNLLEDKFQTQIPLNLILRGTIVRVGNLREPELPLEVCALVASSSEGSGFTSSLREGLSETLKLSESIRKNSLRMCGLEISSRSITDKSF